MIKFVADRIDGKGGGKVIGIGLSRGNCIKLLQDKPIVIDFKDLHLPWNGEIFLFAGETEQELTDQFVKSGLITEETKISIDEDSLAGHSGKEKE